MYLISIFQMLITIVSAIFVEKISFSIYANSKVAKYTALFWVTFIPMISIERLLKTEVICSFILIIGIYFFDLAYKYSNINFKVYLKKLLRLKNIQIFQKQKWKKDHQVVRNYLM